jgi:hypothetical protein
LLLSVLQGERGKERPGRIEEYVSRELLDTLVLLNMCTMHTDDIANTLADGEVLEFVSEED